MTDARPAVAPKVRGGTTALVVVVTLALIGIAIAASPLWRPAVP